MDAKNGLESKDSFRIKFTLRLARLGRIFVYEVPEAMVQDYWEILNDKIEPEVFYKICDELEVSFIPQYGIKFPSPAYFLDKIKGPSHEEAFDLLYSDLQVSIVRGSANPYKERDFGEIIRAEGGVYNLARWTQKDWHFNKARLKDAYVASKNKQEKKALTGHDMPLISQERTKAISERS